MNYAQQGTGEPLILIPYLAADHACYAFQVPEYAKHFTCISVDLRGTGESDKPPGSYTTEQLADDVAAFMQATGIGKAHVTGLSLGGAIGLWLAAKYPDKVSSLSLHSSWARSDSYQRTVVESWQDLAKAVGVPEMIIRAIFPWCFTPELYAERPDYIDFGGVRPQPAAAVRAGLHPAVGCRSGPRRRGTPRANYRADADHLRTP
jgi:pimeloyl-ACP methyl ester carboxylesterase